MTEDSNKIDDVFKKRVGLSDKYSLDNRGNRFNFERLRSRINDQLHTYFGDLNKVRMLDLGAGELFWTEEIMSMGISPENCIGSDLLFWRLAKGQKKGRKVDAVASSAAALPFHSNSFDLISQLTMMTSVPDSAVREKIVLETMRVLRPGGYILWYDFRFNNPFNRHTRAIKKLEIEKLFDGMAMDCETITLLPQLARKLCGPLSLLLNSLHALPILRTHYLAMIGPKGQE